MVSEKVGNNIINYIKDRLLVNHPFLGMLVASVPVILISKDATRDNPISWIGLKDGQILIEESSLLKYFSSNEDIVYMSYLHSLLHFLYCHDILTGDSLEAEGALEGVFKLADSEVNEVLCELESIDLEVTDDHTYWVYGDKSTRSVSSEEIARRKELSRKVLTNLETFSKSQASQGMLLALRKAVRDKKDYKAMLSLFALPEEVVKVSMDEFDYGMYSYGMSINPDMPMVEMVEVSDDTRIRDFVIAIDTSGSTAGHVVQSFLDKTYSVLCTEGAFAERTNIYLIQCDSSISKETVIHSKEEMERVVSSLPISGFGSTDFRPVFARVDELVKDGTLTRLKGLIYYTDGRGIFPSYAPTYKTAFVLTEDMYDSANVPGWAMKIML